MSRIHEALKKAEQERAAAQGNVLDVPAVGEMPNQADVTMSSAAVHAPSHGPQFTYDALLARCPQNSWHPDEKTMLFFSSLYHSAGME